MLKRATALAALLADQADAAEQQRRLTDAIMDAATDADLFRMVVPKHWGGLGLGLETLAQSTRILGTGCPSSAWTLLFLVLHNWLITRFPERFQQEVFGGRGYALMPAPLAPTGQLKEVAGGYQVTGRWEWATGVNHADWVMVHALDIRDDGIVPRFAVLPVDDVTIEDVWFTSGMRATGSNAVRIEKGFVPEHRTVLAAELIAARSADPGNAMAIYPLMAVLAIVAAAPALGAAEAAVDLFKKRVQDRVLAYTSGDKAIDQPAAQIRLATALADARAARAVFDQAIAELDRASRSAHGAGIDDRIAARLAAANVVRMARAVIADVCAGAGASIYYQTSPLQRLQRDVEVLKGHVVFDWDRTAELAGRVALALPLRPTDLV
jgi:alkylation response protein AidB-like acyl-CoA dehydrogenase